jgi:hypothetical protein
VPENSWVESRIARTEIGAVPAEQRYTVFERDGFVVDALGDEHRGSQGVGER